MYSRLIIFTDPVGSGAITTIHTYLHKIFILIAASNPQKQEELKTFYHEITLCHKDLESFAHTAKYVASDIETLLSVQEIIVPEKAQRALGLLAKELADTRFDSFRQRKYPKTIYPITKEISHTLCLSKTEHLYLAFRIAHPKGTDHLATTIHKLQAKHAYVVLQELRMLYDLIFDLIHHNTPEKKADSEGVKKQLLRFYPDCTDYKETPLFKKIKLASTLYKNERGISTAHTELNALAKKAQDIIANEGAKALKEAYSTISQKVNTIIESYRHIIVENTQQNIIDHELLEDIILNTAPQIDFIYSIKLINTVLSSLRRTPPDEQGKSWIPEWQHTLAITINVLLSDKVYNDFCKTREASNTLGDELLNYQAQTLQLGMHLRALLVLQNDMKNKLLNNTLWATIGHFFALILQQQAQYTRRNDTKNLSLLSESQRDIKIFPLFHIQDMQTKTLTLRQDLPTKDFIAAMHALNIPTDKVLETIQNPLFIERNLVLWLKPTL